MKIKVLFFASAREATGQGELYLEVAPNTTPASLLLELQARFPRLRLLSSNLLLAVNGDLIERGSSLGEGDEVALIPPVSGGQGLVELTDKPLDPQKLAAQVRRDSHGAVVLFLGTVRNHSQGKRVYSMEYEAYSEMAERKLRQICQEIEERWGIPEVAIAHRVGHLAVGETSLVIAVASPHREEAFEACQYAVDRIKQIVPIWKKEMREDGEFWAPGG